jgi:hypothetical protein
VELRRALLLFAIVLGLAAVATSFSRPAKRDDDKVPARPGGASGTPTVSPRQDETRRALISFSSFGRPRTGVLTANQAATVAVEVARPGQGQLSGLGMTAVAEPLTPARFEVLENRVGRYPVRFTPSGASAETRTVGALRVVPDPFEEASP